MRVYISGPITGHEENAETRFCNAAIDIEKKFGRETEIINPLLVGGAAAETAKLTHSEFMKISFTLMDLCDAVYFMDGWEKSAGCHQEWIYAQNRNMKVVRE